MNMNVITPAGTRRSNRFFIRKIQAAAKAAFIIAAVLLIAPAPECRAASDANLSKLQPGMPLPALSIMGELTPEQRQYLGLRKGLLGMFAANEFIPADVDADVLVIEFFNVYCTSCQRQAPIMNELFQRVNSRAAMGNRVRFFGIGAGNTETEAAMFMRRYSVDFPLFADPDFFNYEAIGDPGATPLTLIVKKNGKDLRIVSAHAGLVKNPDFFMGEIQKALAGDPVTFAAQAKQAQPDTLATRPRIDLNMSAEEVQKRVLESMNKATDGALTFETVLKKTYPRSGDIYVATAVESGVAVNLYAQVVSRPPTCDVCHGVHFILVFDAEGLLSYFEPLHLTKYGNVKWSAYDIQHMQRKIIGLDVRQPFSYDPSVDSVTTATMTSVLIFNSVQRLRDVVREINGK
jgi:thiol-disulfide isomerase/thioredoxin